jgi:hypothetical protein
MKLVVDLCFVVLAQICAGTSDDKFASFQQAHNKKKRGCFGRGMSQIWEFQNIVL